MVSPVMQNRTVCTLVSIFIAMATAVAAPPGQLVVHEWGTITTVHDAQGVPAVGLNRIEASDELPDFVHRYEPESTRHDPTRALRKSSLAPGRPDVTMRLETPVIYFHPPAGTAFKDPIDVLVRFRGGVINEFYPDAEASVRVDFERVVDKMDSGIITRWDGNVLDKYVVGELRWKGLRLHDTVVAPLTKSPVWLAPREVQSASVFSAEAGEGEQYLFYRGVANLPALLQTRTSSGQVTILAPQTLHWFDFASVKLPNAWLADVRADGTLAFREHGAVTLEKDRAGAELGRIRRFSGSNYSTAAAAELRAAFKRALIRQGLYADEAESMLETWKASYFQKPGLRIFYIVPREWVEYFLPLKFSVPARIERVIVGRIDLH
jgi:hypothetical protein